MKIYIIMYTVDLGGSTVSGFHDRAGAEAKLLELNAEYKAERIKMLISTGRYSTEEAEAWYGDREQYYIEEVDVQ